MAGWWAGKLNYVLDEIFNFFAAFDKDKILYVRSYTNAF